MMTIEDTTEWFVNGWEGAYKQLAYAFYGKMPESAHKCMMYCRRRARTAQERWECVRKPVAVKQTGEAAL